MIVALAPGSSCVTTAAHAETLLVAQPPQSLRVVVSLDARTLWVLRGDDTLRTARVAVASESTLAYQGFGRLIDLDRLRAVNDWATGGIRPDLTVILDLPPEAGLRRRERSADRLEAEPAEFHERVRAGFLKLAAEGGPDRYLVLDATRPASELSRAIQERVREMLPDPVPLTAEEITGSMPAIRE